MKLASYNIQYGIGLDRRFDMARIVEPVGDADIIAFQEVTRGFDKNGGVDLVAALRALMPGHFSAYGPAMDVDAGSAIVDGRAVDRRMQFGNMVLSRFPITTCRAHLLPRTARQARLNLQRGALETVIATPDGPLRVYSVHLDHVEADERMAQIAALRAIAAGVSFAGGAITGAHEFGLSDPPWPDAMVMMGDFNMVPDSLEYAAMIGGDDAAGRLVDIADHLGARQTAGWSWVLPEDRTKRRMLDYCFATPGLAAHARAARYHQDAEGSDHVPLLIELAGLPQSSAGVAPVARAP